MLSNTRKVIGYVSSWAAVGFVARCYQLGLQSRNIFENLGGHLISTVAFGGVGYWAYGAKIRQRELLAAHKERLLIMREKEAEKLAAAAAEEGH